LFFYYLRPQESETPKIQPETDSKKKLIAKCKICDEEPCSITFLPCMHVISCIDCSIRMKRCLECNEIIQEKKTTNGNVLNINKIEFSKLLNKIQALEEAQICSICMERKKDTAFQCGHIACNICALPLKACHICREKVIKRIKIYET
jgi:E3 ubiquitin-protein ligase mind-bomb